MTKLLHAADLHIDSPLRGLERYPDAPADLLRGATRRATENLVALARAERVDAVLLAGDVFDGDWRDFETALFFRRQLVALQEAEIPVFLVSGNHDAASQISRTLSYPENVTVFDTLRPHSARPAADAGFVVHGQGYARRDVTENLAVGYPAAIPGLFNIGLLHTALTGRDGHDRYAPCTEQELAALGYDYWALGHVHTREEVSTQSPYILFPGNIQGRHAKEDGPKGCTLITVLPGRTELEHRDLDVVRWAQVRVDAGDAADLDEVCASARAALDRARAEADKPLAARIVVTGRSEAHAELWRERERLGAELRALAQDYDDVWLEKVRAATSPPQAADPADEGAGAGELVKGILRTARELRADEDSLRKAIEKSDLWSKLPPEARGRDRLDTADASWCGQLLDEAADLLTALLEERSA